MKIRQLLILNLLITYVAASANGNNTEITTPTNGIPTNSSILDATKSTFIITARDTTGSLAGDSVIFWVELNQAETCEIGYGSIACEVLCYPFTAPHDTAAQCESSIHTISRSTKTTSTAIWAIANVIVSGSSTYTVTYHESIEVSDYYTVSAYILTNGGLYARYWDNIWFSGEVSYTEIASEINYQWGVDTAITEYGTDYISIRFEGKIKPPYNETYKFYVYADDGARLWIDKQLIINAYDDCCNESWGAVNLTSYKYHDIIVEYREIRQDAYIELRWSSDSIAKSIVPSTYLYFEEHIKNSPLNVSIYIGPGNVSYEQTTVNDESLFDNNIAGQNNSVYVTATDAFGHVLDIDTAVFNMTNLDGMTTTQTWEGSGIYKINFMSLTSESINGIPFSIELNGYHILNSPYTVYVSPSTTWPGNSTLSGGGLSSAIAGYSAFINITVYDIYGNERESDGDNITLRFYGAAAGHGTCAYLIDNRGVYLCTYTLITAGLYTPVITINNVQLSHSLSISVSSGVIHAPTCDIINSANVDTTLQAGYKENIIIQSRDQFSNALNTTSDNYVVNISDGSMEINATVSSIGGGQYNLTFTPSIIGEFDVNIKLDNTTHISGSLYVLKVIPGDPVGSTSYVIDGTAHTTSQSNIETYFIVQLRDQYNNDLYSSPNSDNSTVFDTSLLQCNSMNTSISCSYYTAGQYNCSYTPTESGTCHLHMKISNINIHNSPFMVTVSPGEINADYCYTYGITDGVAGNIQMFTIQAQDLNGNNLTSGGHTFVTTLIDKHSIYSDVIGEITDNLDGTYSVSYSTEDANVYEALNVQLINAGGLLANYYTDYSFTNIHTSGGQNIIDEVISFDWGTGSPLTVSDGFPASDYFSVEWTGYLYPPYSETYTIYITIYGGSGVRLFINNDLLIDQYDPLDGEADPFIIIQLTANTFYDIQILFREQTGQAKISLEWESASVDRQPIAKDYLYYIKTITNNDDYVGNVSVIPSTTLASACVISGDGLSTARAGFVQTLSIIAKDSYKNIQSSAGNEEVNFELYLIDEVSNRINGSVVDAGNNGDDGQYTATYTITNTSLEYTLYITYNGANAASSPYAVTVTPGNLSLNSSSAVLSSGRAGEEQRFDLYVRDSNYNLIDDQDVNILLTLTHSSGSIITSSSIINNENGIYTITYNATKSGEYLPSITIDGSSLITITNSINISEAIASSSKSKIIGWESGATGSISSSTYIQKTILLIDIYSNTISVEDGYNFYVTIENSSSLITEQVIVTPALNGTYTINFTIPSSGTYYLNVLLASGDVSMSDGLTGEYFNNRWLNGNPIDIQIDTNISLNWGTNLITSTAKDYISVRWSGYIKPAYAETYTLTITSDDGSRLYINNILIFDYFLSNAGTFNGSYTFDTAHLLYPIIIEYRENTDNADIALYWSSSSVSNEVIPQNVLFSDGQHIKSSPFTLTVN